MIPHLFAAVLLAAEPARPVISVLYFENNSSNPELDVMSKGLADMIVTDLVSWDGVTVVERERLESVLKELQLQQSKKFDPATAVKVGKLIGAQYVLSGKMALAGQELRLDATLVNVQTGQSQASASTTGDKDKIFDLEQELVLKLTTAIDFKLKDPGARRKSKVPDLDTLIAYSKAIDLSDQGKVDEAQVAMQALVSKSPAFLMARERKQELLKKLDEFEKRRKDMTTGSVLELGRLADQALAQESKLWTLDPKAQRRFFAMRIIKGRFILRAGKQYLSWRRGHLRIPLKGKEGPALAMMRGWAENQRRLVDEWDRYVKSNTKFINGTPISPSDDDELEPEVEKLIRDAKFGEVRLSADHVDALLDFILEGRGKDGEEGFSIAPALGDADPKEQKAAFDLIEQRLLEGALAAQKRQPHAQDERTAIALLEKKSSALLRLDRDEEAIAALQRILDGFPFSNSATRAEEEIKKLLGAERDNSRDKRERWAKALTTCDDMDIRVGADTLDRKVRRMGLAALPAHAAELEKACKPTPKNRSAFAYVYKDLAMESAYHEDCDGFRAWFTRYVEQGGSISDMLGYQKNYTPWCPLGDVTKSVTWVTARMDRHWDFELDKNQRSYGGNKTMSISGDDSRFNDHFVLNLDADGAGWKCKRAQWRRQGQNLEGTCEVAFTKPAADRGEYDEGTFSASFQDKASDFPRTIELTDGKFRVRRN